MIYLSAMSVTCYDLDASFIVEGANILCFVGPIPPL
jgi:hypothetical protein